MTNIPDQFLELAALVEKRAASQAIEKLLSKLRLDCESAVIPAASKEANAAFVQVQQTLGTWKDVWPRLGPQAEFRLAVAREARAWANRLKIFRPECGT